MTSRTDASSLEIVDGYQKVWREFEDNEITHSAAHYLLAISSLGETGDPPRAADVARQLEVSRAAVSLQLRTLRDHGLVEVGDDHRLRLTGLGTDVVERVASKREIVQAFLHEVLGVDRATAEADACKVEHLISEESGAALARFIRFLRSPEIAGNELIESFRSATVDCPPGLRCEVCSRHCLLRTLEVG